MKKKIFHILTAGIISTDLTMLRTLMMANAFFLISSLTLFLFAALNFTIFNETAAGVVDALTGLISLLALIDLHRNHAISRSIIIGSANFFIFLVFFTYTNQNNNFGLIWTIFFPIFVITLLGHKKGLVLASIFYAIIFSMAYMGIGIWDQGSWDFHSFLRFTIASLVLTYVAYVYEAALDTSNRELAITRQKETEYLEKLKRLSITDPLTGLYNRRHLGDILNHQIEAASRYHSLFSLIIFDIDNFKQINDQHGHNIGDHVLIEIANITKESIRKTDYVSRWGGEEFLILSPNTPLDQASVLADKLRIKIETALFAHDLHVTSSFGVAQYYEHFDKHTLIHNADVALYTAKNTGKNRVCAYDASLETNASLSVL